MAVKRVVEKIFTKNEETASASDLSPLPGLANMFFAKILYLENRLTSVLNLPFGLTVFCIARKKLKDPKKRRDDLKKRSKKRRDDLKRGDDLK